MMTTPVAVQAENALTGTTAIAVSFNGGGGVGSNGGGTVQGSGSSAVLSNGTSTPHINLAKTELKPVECNLCHRKFKNIPALNGHMRLHGGYFKKESDAKKCDKKETPGPPLQTASIGVRALIEEKIISKRSRDLKVSRGEGLKYSLPPVGGWLFSGGKYEDVTREFPRTKKEHRRRSSL